mgnify:CR=1 FL=1
MSLLTLLASGGKAALAAAAGEFDGEFDTGVLDAIGAPLTTYQQALLAISQQMDEVNLMGCRGADGSWFDLKQDSPYADVRDSFTTIEYLMFGSRYEKD